jgi:archaemetzincin
MNLENITLISFGYFEKGLLERIVDDVEREFSVPVKIREGYLALSEHYDLTRKQYNGNELLKVVDSRFASDVSKTLGLFNIDLFIPILTYIFGQAFLNGRSGIASIYRLSNERYGIKKDQNIFIDRIRKEVIHELGHTFGLIHCSNPNCVMRSSTYVEDIDQKLHRLCHKCNEEFNRINHP